MYTIQENMKKNSLNNVIRNVMKVKIMINEKSYAV